MTQFQHVSLFLLRISLGWMFFWAGITKVLNPEWSAAGFLSNAKTFPNFYQWFTTPEILPFTNFLNEWGLTLVGAALILGVFVRLAAAGGILLMLLYYFPTLDFPYPTVHTFLVDDHLIYASALFVLSSLRSGRAWGLENWCARLPICSRYPKIRTLLG